jgi:hypothetical protein
MKSANWIILPSSVNDNFENEIILAYIGALPEPPLAPAWGDWLEVLEEFDNDGFVDQISAAQAWRYQQRSTEISGCAGFDLFQDHSIGRRCNACPIGGHGKSSITRGRWGVF